MENWQLVLVDKFEKTIIINDPEFIPRIGDRVVDFKYSPAPTVKEVGIDYKGKQIVIVLD